MARGAESKAKIETKILSTFEGSFKHEKEIRIPIEENGDIVQIKVVLTCAKTNVESGSDVAIPQKKAETKVSDTSSQFGGAVDGKPTELTEQEKQRTADLVARLGLI